MTKAENRRTAKYKSRSLELESSGSRVELISIIIEKDDFQTAIYLFKARGELLSILG